MIIFPYLVLRDVVRAECGDAQADGDRQALERHHCTAPALPVTGGNISLLCTFKLCTYLESI